MEKRVLVISTNQWPIAARISLSLAKAGFRVATVSRSTSAIRQITAIDAHFNYHPWSAYHSIVRAIKNWVPDFLICSDDRAVEDLHQLHVIARRSKNRAIVDLIETSLGDPASFEIARNKSKFLLFAQSVGVRCPNSAVLPVNRIPERELAVGPFPIILKADRSFGGQGVRIAYDKYTARSAFWELQFPPKHSRLLKRLYARAIVALPPRLLPSPRRTLTRQEFIRGRPVNRAVVCLGGRVLAGISVEAIETASDCGPATVVRVIDNPEMAAMAETLVKRLNLSGFVGFDFILDAIGRSWLLEMNPRLTPTSHFCINTVNLAAALFQRLTGGVVHLPAPIADCEPIVLFPQELQRCPSSKHLLNFSQDIPWDEPTFVQVCLNWALRSHSRERMLDRVRVAFAASNKHERVSGATGSEPADEDINTIA